VADTFDPYREALIVETSTVWPSEFDGLDPARKMRLEEAFHAQPDKCASLEYVRMHTGFCRHVNVTEADVQRVGG
jgi:hypothetical protein